MVAMISAWSKWAQDFYLFLPIPSALPPYQAERDLTTDAHERIVEALRTRSYPMAKQAAWDTVQIWYQLMMHEEQP